MAANFGMNDEMLVTIIGNCPFTDVVTVAAVVSGLKYCCGTDVAVGCNVFKTGSGCCGSCMALISLEPPVVTMETGIAWKTV